MKQDISNEIEKIISYCKSKECDECKYRANDDLCNLHNPTAWNVNQMNEMEAIRELKSLSPSESSIETVLNLIEKQQAEIEDCKKCVLRDEVHNYIEELEKKDKIIKMLLDEREHIKNNLEVDLNKKGVYAQAKGQVSQILEYYQKNDKYFNQKIEKGE